MTGPLLDVRDLKTHFFTDDGVVKSVDGVSFSIEKGETFGLVGESGCGKSVTALSIMRLIPSPPGKIIGGSIDFEGTDLVGFSEREMQKIRGNKISMIFQEPMTSLDPVFTIGSELVETIRLHQHLDKDDAWDKAVEMLELVGIPDPQSRMKKYPHELSGGMRQRVMIAMALACEPSLLIADEPTTALDVTIQAQILTLMEDLKRTFDTAILLITHDLGVVAQHCANVAVMYAGNIVEQGSVYDIFDDPRHPYTQGLIRSVPSLDRAVTRLEVMEGTVPNLIDPPKGCRFRPRCTVCGPECLATFPDLRFITESHLVRCNREVRT
ncbi:MAG: ABC transporter ATP-binding protein [Candidatus Methanofastidiosa archaeon]|nr:ABC transporter ATP-binding protein [Candidatus Methanofastidiosa archaeon]